MLVESGLVLALDDDKIKVPGGLYTPAACQGELLMNRLLNTGTTMKSEYVVQWWWWYSDDNDEYDDDDDDDNDDDTDDDDDDDDNDNDDDGWWMMMI